MTQAAAMANPQAGAVAAPASLSGFVADMDEATYHARPEISSGFVRTLLQRSPAHARAEADEPAAETPALVVGRAVHTRKLEPGSFAERYSIAPKVDRRTKAGKEAWAAFCDAHPDAAHLSESDGELIEGIAEAIEGHPLASALLLFDGAQKGLLLNKTNAGVLVAALEEETDLWRGHLVELYPTRVPFGGRMVDAVRLRIPADPPAATDPGNVTTHSGAAQLGNPPAGMRPEHAASMAAQAPAPTAKAPEVPARGTAAPAVSIPF